MENPMLSNGTSALSVVLAEQHPSENIIEPSTPQEHNDNIDCEATNDTVSRIVNIQPKREDGSLRLPFPITTAEWQTLDVRHLNPQWGLQLLADIEQILIQQTIELEQLLSTIESENRYVIKVPEGITLFVGAEYSCAWQRLCCGTSRGFTLHLLDPTKQEALMLVRRLAGTVGCYVQKMEVYVPSGIYIGCVKQEATLMVPHFIVQNSSGNSLFTIEGPKCCACFMYSDANFQVISASDGNQVGSISHNWNDRTGNYGLLVTFPSRNADPRTKALLIAAGFLLEYMFFESAKSRGCVNCCFKR